MQSNKLPVENCFVLFVSFNKYNLALITLKLGISHGLLVIIKEDAIFPWILAELAAALIVKWDRFEYDMLQFSL